MRWLIGVAFFFYALLSSQAVAAHVLVTDTTKSKGAILHIIPDDDPIAGQPASFYFDTQDRLLDGSGARVTLAIHNPNSEQTVVPMKLLGTLATVDYTFPVQGVYHLTFTVVSDGKTVIFEQGQRVSRGTAGSALDKPAYAWAETLLIVCGVGLALLAIVGFNNRRLIAKQSHL